MSIRHVVTWGFIGQDPGDRRRHATDLAQQLRSLLGQVPTLRRLEVALNSLEVQDNWDLVLIADFDDEQGLYAYQEHPAHQAVGVNLKSLTAKRSAVDFQI